MSATYSRSHTTASPFGAFKTAYQKVFAHPGGGRLDFAIHALTSSEARDQQLIFYVPRDEATREGLARMRCGVTPTCP